MSASSNKRFQTVNVFFLENTPAGTKTVFFTTDSDYKNVTAVALYETTTGGLANYKVGLKSDPGGAVIQEPTHRDDWKSSTAVAVEQRYKKLGNNGEGIQAAGQKYAITVVIPTVVGSSNLDFDLVFVLEN